LTRFIRANRHPLRAKTLQPSANHRRLRDSRWIFKEFRRDSLAFAAFTASVLADFFLGTPLCVLPISPICVAIVAVLPEGWVFIGPVVDLVFGILVLGMEDNSAKPAWFDKCAPEEKPSASAIALNYPAAKPSPWRARLR
jgi:hypothetical protein